VQEGKLSVEIEVLRSMTRMVEGGTAVSRYCHERRTLNAATGTVMVAYPTCATRSAARSHELM
jgi:hypothetical protein